jgi:hypothetical protein
VACSTREEARSNRCSRPFDDGGIGRERVALVDEDVAALDRDRERLDRDDRGGYYKLPNI